ncbi:hypothetical protein NPIL_680241 [Nephila pilipes]|uniref:Uncharacterized protein n=1 Tax=Nephila pilipes TaxID=299642 RepID=A0A8X6QVN3_NEPPI|nr:hypothetical protein NPIL_680241 [Nephila pilipes]
MEFINQNALRRPDNNFGPSHVKASTAAAAVSMQKESIRALHRCTALFGCPLSTEMIVLVEDTSYSRSADSIKSLVGRSAILHTGSSFYNHLQSSPICGCTLLLVVLPLEKLFGMIF